MKNIWFSLMFKSELPDKHVSFALLAVGGTDNTGVGFPFFHTLI